MPESVMGLQCQHAAIILLQSTHCRSTE